jgi:ATP-dependent Lon protease
MRLELPMSANSDHQHGFSVQIRGFDAAKSGAKAGVASLVALSSALLRK